MKGGSHTSHCRKHIREKPEKRFPDLEWGSSHNDTILEQERNGAMKMAKLKLNIIKYVNRLNDIEKLERLFNYIMILYTQ